jgi:DNA-binding MarR family transcriptional regulator
VIARATPKALALLQEIDPAINRLDDQALSCLSEPEISQLVDLLARVRGHLVKK